MQRWFYVFGVIAILGGGLQGFAADESSVYKNKESGFSIRFPSSWEIKEGAAGMAVQAVGPAKAGQVRPSISVGVETVPQTMTLDEYAPRGFEKARSAMPDLKVLRIGRQRVSNTRAKWWIVSFGADPATVKGFLFVVVKGGRAFRIIAVAPLDQYPSFKDLLGRSVGSLIIE